MRKNEIIRSFFILLMISLFPITIIQKPAVCISYNYQIMENIPDFKPLNMSEEILMGAIFYSWWGDLLLIENFHWDQGISITPKWGQYNSIDQTIVRKQIKTAQQYGIDFFAVCWFGSTNRAACRENRLGLESGLLDSEWVNEIRFCIFYELISLLMHPQFSSINKTQMILDDFRYMCENYFNLPNYLTLNNRPVVFMYESYSIDSLIDLENALNASRKVCVEYGYSPFIIGDLVRPTIPSTNLFDLFDGATTYAFNLNPSWTNVIQAMEEYYPLWLNTCQNQQKLFIPAVYPGFNDTGFEVSSGRILTRDLEKFNQTLNIGKETMDPDHKIVTVFSWNEYHEATAIEPTKEDGCTFLEIVNKYSSSYGNISNMNNTSDESIAPLQTSTTDKTTPVSLLVCSLVIIPIFRRKVKKK
ncbi:MAG: glycoside hydrolase family 99-like domain-containing protein [Candidatus Hodarchaeota archaeon]